MNNTYLSDILYYNSNEKPYTSLNKAYIHHENKWKTFPSCKLNVSVAMRPFVLSHFHLPHFNASLNNTSDQLYFFPCESCLAFVFSFFVPLLNTIHHLSHTFTAGWRPESNRASFLMMLPTPGMTAWSRRTSQSNLPLWLLTASSERETLNLGEHTSRLSIALTLCSQSSVNLQAHRTGGVEKRYGCCYRKCAPRSTGALSRLHVSKLCLSYILFHFVYYETGQHRLQFQTAGINVCLAAEKYTRTLESMNRTNVMALFFMQQ